jgi:tRNA A37 threonylcarbamoyladenosine synthetase subunit TsaC/SUA5/YrdC
MSARHASPPLVRTTQILAINAIQPPPVNAEGDLAAWFQTTGQHSLQAAHVVAAAALRQSAIPVAFPTEIVYGLGADAT